MKFKRVGGAPAAKKAPVPAPVKKLTEGIDTEAHLKAAERYRQLADLSAEDEINESTLDKRALTRAACECGVPSGELKETLLRKKLTEDAADDAREAAMKKTPEVQQAARQLQVGDKDIVVLDFPDLEDVDEDDVDDINDLEYALDRCLKQAKLVTGRKNPKNRLQIVNALIVGQAGTGKAQPLTSRVYTPTGYKLMGDVRPGDIVLDGKGNPTEVLGVFPQGERDIYKIHFNDGTYIEVADSHLNSVYRIWSPSAAAQWRGEHRQPGREDFVIETTKLKEMVETQRRPSSPYGHYDNPKFCVDTPTIQDWGDGQPLPIDPYLLGCLIGDGCLSQLKRGAKGTGLLFTTADAEIKEHLDQILRRDWNACLRSYDKSEKPLNWFIRNVDELKYKRPVNTGVSALKAALRALRLDTTSYHKFIPSEYLYTSFENRLALLQGLMDTDGFISNRKHRYGGKTSEVEFDTVSSQLAEDVAFLVRSLGCIARVHKRTGCTYRYVRGDIDKRRGCADRYRVSIGFPQEVPVFSLSRKANLMKQRIFNSRRAIDSIEFDRREECQCIYVASPEHTYITDNLTVTHNSSLIKKWAQTRGVHLAEYDLSTLNPEDMGGAVMPDPDNPRMIIHAMSSSTWRNLSQPNTVLFFDEYNRAKSSIRSTVMKLINDHILPGPDGEEQYMPNILFTIAAINPVTASYGGVSEMDRAEEGRFATIYMTISKIKTLKHLDAAYAEMVDAAIEAGDPEQAMEYQGRRALAREILQSRQFQFTSPDEEEKMSDDSRFRPTTPRHLEIAISSSDGTKEGLLRVWSRSCDYRQKKVIEDILRNYTDVQDKANSVFNTETASGVIGSKSKFTKAKSSLERLEDLLNSQGHSLYGGK